MEDAIDRVEEKLDNFIEKADGKYVMRREFIVAI